MWARGGGGFTSQAWVKKEKAGLEKPHRCAGFGMIEI